jgi:hypothetical protein
VTDPHGELRPAYRTLNEPTRLLGLSPGGWAAVLGAGGAAYAWLMLSPLPWRLNFSLVAIVLGAPLALLLLREASAVGPARMLLGALRWRMRPTRIVALDGERLARRGAVRLDRAPDAPAPSDGAAELPWLEPEHIAAGEGT